MNRQGELVLVATSVASASATACSTARSWNVQDGTRVKAGQVMAEWTVRDAIVTEVFGLREVRRHHRRRHHDGDARRGDRPVA